MKEENTQRKINAMEVMYMCSFHVNIYINKLLFL